LIKDAQNYYIKGNKPNCSGHRILKNKKRESLKDKVNELAMNGKNIRFMHPGAGCLVHPRYSCGF
jgi:hypothetical protein